MAYIDRDLLYEAITDLPFTEGCAVYDSYDVENTIRNFPEADVVEVIRCKDCIYKHTAESIPLTYCKVLSLGIVRPVIIEDNDFCSFGKRKEVEQ